LAVGSGLVLGGAIGNLSERIVGGPGGEVPDFITLRDWPTFNVADACVTVGVIVIIVALLFGGRAPARPEAEGAA
jgi:signal peptidase II